MATRLALALRGGPGSGCNGRAASSGSGGTSSIGTTDATFDPADLDVAINGVWVCKQSTPHADPATVDLKPREVSVTIDLKSGSERATVWTNDLTHAYVHENSAYSS